jgi:hypothetical protein
METTPGKFLAQRRVLRRAGISQSHMNRIIENEEMIIVQATQLKSIFPNVNIDHLRHY